MIIIFKHIYARWASLQDEPKNNVDVLALYFLYGPRGSGMGVIRGRG
jgi:hypothetical protein